MIKLRNHQFKEIPRNQTFIYNSGVDEEELIKLGNHQFKEIPRNPTHFANPGVNYSELHIKKRLQISE